MSEVDEFVKNNTFHCSILHANITYAQCRANCITATRLLKSKIVNEYRLENKKKDIEDELVKAGLWDRGADTTTIKCIGCNNFVPPSSAELSAFSARLHDKRYDDTDDGKIERQLIAYVAHSQEKLHGEEYRYLSKASPVSADVSEVYSRFEEVGSHVHKKTGAIQTDEGEY